GHFTAANPHSDSASKSHFTDYSTHRAAEPKGGGGGAGDITNAHFNDFSTSTQGKLNQKATLRANAQFGVISSAGIQATSQSGRGVYGRSNTFTGVKGESVSGVGAAGVSTSNMGITGTSVTNTGVSASSDSGPGVSASTRMHAAGWFAQLGDIPTGQSFGYSTLFVYNQLSGAGSWSGAVAEFNDISTIATATGPLISGKVGNTEYLRLNPKVANGSSAVVYILDTKNSLSTTGALLLSLRNAGTEKFAVGYDGKITGTRAALSNPGTDILTINATGSGVGVTSTSNTGAAVSGTSTSGPAIQGITTKGNAGTFSQQGALTADLTADTMAIGRSNSGSYNVSASIPSLVDNTTTTLAKGDHLKGWAAGSAVFSLYPYIADSSSAVGYFF